MPNDTLPQIRELLAHSLANLKKCKAAYQALVAFKDDPQALGFCVAHLHQEATALHEHTERLAQIADDLHIMYGRIASGVIRPDEMFDADGHLREL